MGNKEEKIKWWKENKSTFVSITTLFFTVTIGGLYFIISNPTGWLANHFLVLVLFWLLLLSFILYLFVGRHVSYYVAPQHNSKARIAILLPLSCPDGYENEDLKLMIEGFGKGLRDFTSRKHEELSETYELVFIDNKVYKSAIEKVTEELDFGTKYFISTMSKFSLKFSEEFKEIKGDAILINTISGSSLIKEETNTIYNFYPTSKYEIEMLIDDAIKNELKKPFIYCFSSKFTEECRDTFVENWNKKNTDEYEIKEEENSFDFANSSDINFKHPAFYNDTVENADSIYIFGYGSSFYDIIRELRTNYEGIKSKAIYTISTFKYRDWKDEEKQILNDMNITTIRPCLQNEEFSTEQDVVEYFAEQTLDRLLNTLELMNSKTWMKFDKAWKKSKQRKLELIGGNVIKVKAVKL